MDDLGISDAPADVVAFTVLQVDGRTALGAEQTRTYLAVDRVRLGYSWADANCVVDKVVDAIGADAFETLPLGKVAALQFDHPELVDAAASCASPESTARADNVTSNGGIDIQDPIPGPDPDPAAVRSMFETFHQLGAKVAGLTDDELACIVEPVTGSLADAEYIQIAQGKRSLDSDAAQVAVAECLDSDRLDEVAAKAGATLLESREAAAEERARVEALMAEQAISSIDGATADSTVPTTAPTTAAGN